MKTKEKTDGEKRYAAWVGFDWADEEHMWVLQGADTGERQNRAGAHRKWRQEAKAISPVCHPGFARLLQYDGSPMKYELELELTDDDLFELKSALELSRYLAQQYGNDDRRERCQELQKKLDASERKFRKNGNNGRASG
jgi:hypothetical protein